MPGNLIKSLDPRPGVGTFEFLARRDGNEIARFVWSNDWQRDCLVQVAHSQELSKSHDGSRQIVRISPTVDREDAGGMY